MMAYCKPSPFVWRNAYGAAQVLGSNMPPADIIEIVANNYQVSVNKIVKKSRKRAYTEPRQVAIYLIRKTYPKMPFKHIGGLFELDHSTAIYSIDTVNDLMFSDSRFKARVNQLLERINRRHDHKTEHTAS
ncbi:helix-turn-helix domain-containing protein [Mucilaginibacter ximonensis]|uniref:Helix-turn-helix domain-containing protein n=1 Tax=Mucilaginibacter ximonensis TaxID=538021 RepID=A0ABW5YFK6_9SPHI